MSVRVRPLLRADWHEWSRMRVTLWGEEALRDDLDRIFAESARKPIFLPVDECGAALGFAEASLRVDYVNGTETSPVGFLEGLYVEPAVRGCGVGRALVAAVEARGRTVECSELGSDGLLDNTASYAAHRAYGFEEAERVVYFRKRIAS